ncbi:type II toxin-antitoxin system mRNA interferase toxin, RelE/StbE family [Patescibacteria group bacterium]|nr:type II toxin-antitoxin system mRNA interferase toxin, RelE/StbE family [Patescibacteria group bacterium]MBU4511956.1 type II toxin-antitoxin system mRNA interferase toxin, RelE/StbE family [Patescibacteria group bacterium]MCG2693360.1 type II toxin-antitoxin system mRNA interferase toxin, RelE/StbE family [Candidatus Parcubacteria bacterium]
MKNIIEIKVGSRYKKSFRRLSLRIQKEALQKINIFRVNPFDLRLKTHSLSGKSKDCLAFWITYSYRVKFIFLSKREVLFLDVGTHRIYKR